MTICFKTLKNPDKYYNSASIVFITPEGNRNKLLINNDDLSVELGYKIQNVLKCNPTNTSIIIDYNNKFQTAVVEYKSPELYYIRNISRIMSIKLEYEVSVPRCINFADYDFDATDNAEINDIHKQLVDGQGIGKMVSNLHPVLEQIAKETLLEKNFKHPLIYRLKERQDYKDNKQFLDNNKLACNYAVLYYDHDTDQCYIIFDNDELLRKPNITILEVYQKS